MTEIITHNSKPFSLTQSGDWKAFQEKTGRTVLTVKVGDREFNIVIFTPKFNVSWGLLLGADIGSLSINEMERLFEGTRQFSLTHLRVEGHEKTPLLEGQKNAFPFRVERVDKPYLPEHTLKLDLSKSEDELLADMKRKGRYNIKVANKHNVEIKTYIGGNVPEGALDDFYTLLESTGDRDGFSIHGKSYYKTMLSVVKGAHLYLAYKDGNCLGGIIVCHSETEAIYYYGAMDHTHRKFMAPYALQWTAILDAKKAHKKMYDFMGIAQIKDGEFDVNDPLYNVGEFKLKFGGEVFVYSKPVDIIFRPLAYRLIKVAKKFR